MTKIPQRTVERFFRYCQFLHSRLESGSEYVFSHELAAAVGVSPEQVRRDLMNFDLAGTPQRGYPIKEFMAELYSHLESSSLTKMVLVGVGNLGKAILSYFLKRRPNLSIVAAFDQDPEKVNRVYSGCQVHHIGQLEKTVAREKAAVGIVTVPASTAQEAADALVRAGVRGIVNFAPVQLKVPPGIFLEQLDITLSIEKVAYFARKNAAKERLK
ncbi:MAG: redox-sensing transcriptional repressor Rex [Elusimicrobia bacterium HGW-Elusimicrobia-3]|jgi:redox-sensing transcriptional repressor|nr:MAG: redox-sensing transcriptional repressor Rex [Elusimicrobia bacterium HGW-Elusimicrobia-3]